MERTSLISPRLLPHSIIPQQQPINQSTNLPIPFCSRVIAFYSPARRDWRLLCVFALAFPDFSSDVCMFYFLFAAVSLSSVLLSVPSPVIKCFRATLVAPQLLVAAARSRLLCAFLPRLKKSQSSKCLGQEFKT